MFQWLKSLFVKRQIVAKKATIKKRKRQVRLTEAQWQDAIKLYNSGFSTIDLEKHFNVSNSNISLGLRKRGVKMRAKHGHSKFYKAGI